MICFPGCHLNLRGKIGTFCGCEGTCSGFKTTRSLRNPDGLVKIVVCQSLRSGWIRFRRNILQRYVLGGYTCPSSSKTIRLSADRARWKSSSLLQSLNPLFTGLNLALARSTGDFLWAVECLFRLQRLSKKMMQGMLRVQVPK